MELDMSGHQSPFELPNQLEHYLAALSKLYAQDGKRKYQEIIVNSQMRISEKWTDDEWLNSGHAIFLTVPESLYLGVVKDKIDLQQEIRDDLNKLHSVRGEFVAEVFLEMERGEDEDWRRKSGLLVRSRQRVVSPMAEERIWNGAGYRVFLSHKSEVKQQTGKLKEWLEPFGVSSFVAHTDIHPTKEWQDEIENALASMDAFVALLTGEFHDSDWTDQEVGYALGRGVPLIAIKLGRDPYGFIGRFQALACEWDDAPVKLVALLIKYPRMLEAYINALPHCRTFGDGNVLAEVLPAIASLTDEQAQRMQSAFNENSQLQGSYGFSGKWPGKYGPGLAEHLTRVTGKKHLKPRSGEIDLQ
jgi:hypothetical protein